MGTMEGVVRKGLECGVLTQERRRLKVDWKHSDGVRVSMGARSVNVATRELVRLGMGGWKSDDNGQFCLSAADDGCVDRSSKNQWVLARLRVGRLEGSPWKLFADRRSASLTGEEADEWTADLERRDSGAWLRELCAVAGGVVEANIRRALVMVLALAFVGAVAQTPSWYVRLASVGFHVEIKKRPNNRPARSLLSLELLKPITPEITIGSSGDLKAFRLGLSPTSAFVDDEILRKVVVGRYRGHSLPISYIDATISCIGAALAEPSPEAIAVELPPLPTEFPSLSDITPLAYEKLRLPNGLQVFLLEDHELGLVGGELLVRGGGKLEPADKVGMAALTSIVQRSGGSIKHAADELDAQLEAMAARIETTSSVSEMSVAFRCLTEDLLTVFPLFSEVIQEPLMPLEKLELTQSQFLGAIARRADDAEGIAAREFNKLLYGDNSVYSRVAEVATVTAISRDDLVAFHSQNFRPEKGVLGIWGDFNAADVKKMVEQHFGHWTAPTEDAAWVSATPNSPPFMESGFSTSSLAVYVIDRPGLTQGYVRMGEFGTTLADPDVFALDVLNGILNGFGGLLFDEVRSRDGLAYSVSGGWTPAVEHRGAFVAGGETRVQTIPQFVKTVKRVLEDLTSDAPDGDLLARAKEAALNSFIFNFADSGAQLERILSYELFGIDQNFLFKYKSGVESTTPNDILKVAQRHLHPRWQPVLIVTDAQKLEPLLSTFDIPVVKLQPKYLKAS